MVFEKFGTPLIYKPAMSQLEGPRSDRWFLSVCIKLDDECIEVGLHGSRLGPIDGIKEGLGEVFIVGLSEVIPLSFFTPLSSTQERKYQPVRYELEPLWEISQPFLTTEEIDHKICPNFCEGSKT